MRGWSSWYPVISIKLIKRKKKEGEREREGGREEGRTAGRREREGRREWRREGPYINLLQANPKL